VITLLGASYISWQGHLGGFVGGVLLAVVLVYAPRKRRTLWQYVGLGSITALIAVGIVLRTLALT
jgi:membrane associated rhomboid family serine protease